MARKRRKVRCKAKCKRTGKPCRNYAVTGHKVCRMHGAGSPSKGKAGGRPTVHGMYSSGGSMAVEDITEQLLTDPELTNGLRDIAMIRALTGRSLEMLKGEEADFLADLATGDLEKKDERQWRSRLMGWYDGLASGNARTIATIDRYYAALERRIGGASMDGLRAAMLAIARVIADEVKDGALRKRLEEQIETALDKVVIGVEKGGA